MYAIDTKYKDKGTKCLIFSLRELKCLRNIETSIIENNGKEIIRAPSKAKILLFLRIFQFIYFLQFNASFKVIYTN